MNSRLRLGPPKQMLATISGTAVGLDDDVIGRVEPLAAGLQRPGANTAAAIQVGWTMPERSKHYHLRTKNCLHATYAVIHAYGATDIPNPSWFDMLPNKYYKDFKGHERLLHR